MTSVIQELAGEDTTLSHAHVHERVEDWKQRLSDLYDEIVSWTPDLGNDRSRTMEMHEELMREYGVAATQIPVLRLFQDEQEIAKFLPNGLWIIGVNGRVDLFSAKGQFLIVDRSENFSPSRWEIAPSLRRFEREPLSRESLLRALR